MFVQRSLQNEPNSRSISCDAIGTPAEQPSRLRRTWGRLGVVTQAIVTGMAVDERSGRVRGVTYLKGGEEYFQPDDVGCSPAVHREA
jgi:hypothetical protein